MSKHEPTNRELLVRIDERVNQIAGVKKDHEQRIRKMERKWYTSVSAFVMAAVHWVKEGMSNL